MDSNQENQLLLISLARITFLSLSEKLNLLKKLDSFNSLALLSIEDIEQLCNRKLRAVWDGKENLRCSCRELKILQAKGIKISMYNDCDYPALLRESVNAPFLLFYIGNLGCVTEKTVSVVGSRRITPEAKAAAHRFGREAVESGYTVVSGLAYGVDGAVHGGAVSALLDACASGGAVPSGRTAAVLPCGIDGITPYSNRKLAEQIVSTGGVLLSEYVPGTPAENWRFVQRNRIIAALSPATVVVQAPAGSGALITADFALEGGRDVMFHQAAFTENAEAVRRAVESQLAVAHALGKVSRSKLENTPEKYLEAGAPVISDFQDFLKCVREVPGERHCKKELDSQLELALI